MQNTDAEKICGNTGKMRNAENYYPNRFSAFYAPFTFTSLSLSAIISV